MNIAVAAILSASLACSPGDVPFLKLPEPAVRSGELRTAAIPGAVPIQSAALRLDGHAMSAMYGAAEALWQRAVIPSLTDCGPRRPDDAKGLVETDFTGSTNGVDALYLMGEYAYASNRNLSARGRRIGSGLRDILGTHVFGGGSKLGFASAAGANPLTGDAYWLAPGIDHAAMPTGKWCLDDETKTADWARYLVLLGELDAKGVFDKDDTPYTIPPYLSVTGSRDWDGYMHEGRFPTIYDDVYGKDMGTDRTYGVCPSGTGRGSALTNMTLKGLLGDLASGARIEGVATQDTARVWWERFALANAASAACSTLLDVCSQVSFYMREDELAGMDPPDDRGFSYALRREKISGFVSGTLTLKGEGDAVHFGGQEAPATGGTGSFVALLDWNKFSTASLDGSEDVSAETTTVERATAAWLDSDGNGSVALATSATVKVEDLDLDSTNLSGMVDEGDYGLGYAISVDGRGGYAFNLVLDSRAGFARVGTFRWPAPDCWTSSVTVAYSASVSGVETLGVKLPIVGPTWRETPNYVPWAGIESVRTVAGAGYHPMCFDGGCSSPPTSTPSPSAGSRRTSPPYPASRSAGTSRGARRRTFQSKT